MAVEQILATREMNELTSGYETRADRARAVELYKEALSATYAETDDGRVSWSGQGNALAKSAVGKAAGRKRAEQLEALEKSLSPDQVSLFGSDLAAMRQDVVKDWTPSSPVGGTGLTPYDLEAPAKVLVPLHTPLRNTTPREKGQGTARKFKRIDSFSNAGIPGGAAALSPSFNSTTQTSTWGPTGNLTLARPQKISYTGSDHSVSYVELGFSDSVDYIAQYQGVGFDDLRALSHTAVLYAHMMGEERQDLFGRGTTANGYEGVVAAPTTTIATASTGGSIGAGTYSVYVTASSGFGEGLPSTVQTTSALTGSTNTITISLTAEPQGAINYNVYVGTTTGITNAHYQGNFTPTNVSGVPTITLTTYSSSGATGTGVDTSTQANGYDGWLSVESDPTLTGYFSRLNGKLSTTNPGSEFDTALQQMFVNNGADPDEIWMTGAVRNEFGQLLRVGGSNGAASGYRTNLQTGDGSVTMGTSVTGYVNQNTGKVLDVRTHRFMPAGAALIRSLSVPIPIANVTAPVVKVNVQDYMAIDWPQIQLTYDVSTYQIGTLVHYAPAWHGVIFGIN